MGWCSDEWPGHEGYLTAWQRLEDGSGDLVEIRCPHFDEPPGPDRLNVAAVQVGCDCGWRSPLLRAPHGTEWRPCHVELPKHEQEDGHRDWILGEPWPCFERSSRQVWAEHCADLLTPNHARCTPETRAASRKFLSNRMIRRGY